MRTVYEVICEWDIGQEDQLFRSEDAAIEWATANLKLQFGDDPDYTFSALVEEGLIETNEKSII